jgi:PTS system cellobiose-specific IIA component
MKEVKEEKVKVDRDALNGISMQVILHAGNARDIVLKILDQLAGESINEVEVKKELDAARKELNEAHSKQTAMIQREAEGEYLPYSVLFVHSQDTLMTIQSELLVTEKLIKIVLSLQKKK